MAQGIRRKAALILKAYTGPDWVASVKRITKFYDIPQASLAAQAGVSEPDLSRWLRGKVEPSLHSMLRVDAALFELVADAKREQVEA